MVLDDDPVFVVDGHRFVRLEDRDTCINLHMVTCRYYWIMMYQIV